LKYLSRLILVAAVAAALLTGIRPADAAGVVRAPIFMQPSQPAFAATPDATAEAAYCTSTGGVVEHRVPVFGTNNPPKQWLVLNGYADFCQYTKGKGATSSRIHLLLTTLNATKPTLATLAYYAKVPLKSANCTGGGNPASCYCTFLGGSDQFGGTNFAGGAWVLQNTTDVALEVCMFPDMSAIDSWGLTYHSDNIIRGIDLSKVLKYQHKG
jgi:putative hemolysin